MKRDGFTSSPYLVRELAAAMTGGESGLPERFKPSRKLLSYRRRKDAVAGAVTSTLAGEYSHALRLPAYRTKEWTEVHRQKLEGIYEKRSLRDFGIHPELIHLYESDEFFALADHPRELN